MKRLLVLAAVVLCFGVFSAFSQASNLVRTDMSPAEVDRIVKKLTENEAKFRDALTGYIFSRSATIQTVGMGGQITGTYRRDSQMALTEDGKRIEKINFFPVSTLTEIIVTAEDLEDLGGVNPFALEPRAMPLYKFDYVGKEKIDDLNLYVFDVAPKVMPDKNSKQRLFIGRIWVDDEDLMIVKSKGKAVPETKKQKFPVVETWRENVDGKFWFPAYTSSDDELVFDSGQAVKMKIRVKYTDYAQGHTDVKIIEETEEVLDEPAPASTPKKP